MFLAAVVQQVDAVEYACPISSEIVIAHFADFLGYGDKIHQVPTQTAIGFRECHRDQSQLYEPVVDLVGISALAVGGTDVLRRCDLPEHLAYAIAEAYLIGCVFKSHRPSSSFVVVKSAASLVKAAPIDEGRYRIAQYLYGATAQRKAARIPHHAFQWKLA